MDSLLYFLRFKALDRSGLTLRIFLFIVSTLTLLYLACSFNFEQFLALNSSTLKLILRSAPELVFIAIFGGLLLWFLAVLIPWIHEVFGWITTPCSFPFEPEDYLNNIDFQGKVEKRNRGLSITSSGAGMLFKHYWKDFEANFEFQFLGETENEPLKISYEMTNSGNKYCTKNNYLGFIFRARDFDNYFMLSIGVKRFIKQTELICEDNLNLKDKEFLFITPHVKVGGAWDVFIGEQTLVEKVKNFSVGGDNKLIIHVKGNILKLWIEKPDKKEDQKNQKVNTKNREPIFTWHLPTHYLINWGKEKVTNSYSPGDSSKIPFRNSLGRVGFRAYGNERFLVKNLRIKKID